MWSMLMLMWSMLLRTMLLRTLVLWILLLCTQVLAPRHLRQAWPLAVYRRLHPRSAAQQGRAAVLRVCSAILRPCPFPPPLLRPLGPARKR